MRLQGKKRLCIVVAVLNMCVATGAVDFDDEELGHWDRLGQSVASRVGWVISKPTKVLTRATSASTDLIRRASERIIKPQHTKDPSAHDKDSSPTDTTTANTKQTPHDGHPAAPSSAGEKLTQTIGEAVTHAQDAIKEYTHALPHAHTSPSTDTHTRAHTQTTPEAPWPFSSSSSTDQSASSDSESHPLLGTLKSLASSSSSDTESSPSSSSSSSSHTTSSSSSDTHATGRSVHHAQAGEHKGSQEDGDRGVIEDDTFAYALVHTLPPTLPMAAAALVVVLGFLSALLWPFKKGTLVDGIEDVKDEVVSREVPTHGESIMEDGTHHEHERAVEKSTDAASAMDTAMHGDKKASAGHGNDGVPSRNDAEDGEGDVHHSAREEPVRAHDKPQQVGDTVDDGEGSPTGATGADNDADGDHHHHDNKTPSEEGRTGATDEHASDHSTTTSRESSSSTTSTNGKAAHGQDDDAADAHTHAHEDHTHTREDTHAHANAHHDDGHPHHGQRRYASTPSPATTAPSDDEDDAHHHHHHQQQHDQEHEHQRQGGEHEERGVEEDNGGSKKHHHHQHDRPIDEGVESPSHAHGDGYHDDDRHHDQHPGPADDWPSLTHEEELSRADNGGEQGLGEASEGVSGGEGVEEGEEGGTGLQMAPLQGCKDYAHAVKATIPSEDDSHEDSHEMSARALSAALPSLS